MCARLLLCLSCDGMGSDEDSRGRRREGRWTLCRCAMTNSKEGFHYWLSCTLEVWALHCCLIHGLVQCSAWACTPWLVWHWGGHVWGSTWSHGWLWRCSRVVQLQHLQQQCQGVACLTPTCLIALQLATCASTGCMFWGAPSSGAPPVAVYCMCCCTCCAGA